jgi:putative glutamine amidotransferase
MLKKGLLPIDLVQWHPELLMQTSDDMLPLFKRFVQNCQNRLNA